MSGRVPPPAPDLPHTDLSWGACPHGLIEWSLATPSSPPQHPVHCTAAVQQSTRTGERVSSATPSASAQHLTQRCRNVASHCASQLQRLGMLCADVLPPQSIRDLRRRRREVLLQDPRPPAGAPPASSQGDIKRPFQLVTWTAAPPWHGSGRHEVAGGGVCVAHVTTPTTPVHAELPRAVGFAEHRYRWNRAQRTGATGSHAAWAAKAAHPHSHAMSQSGETSFVFCRSAVRALSVAHESVTRCVVPSATSVRHRAPSASASCHNECCSGAARIELSNTCGTRCRQHVASPSDHTAPTDKNSTALTGSNGNRCSASVRRALSARPTARDSPTCGDRGIGGGIRMRIACLDPPSHVANFQML